MYELTDDEFDKFKDICYRLMGIKLCESKRSLVISRLSSRLKALNFTRFSDYINFLASDSGGKEITTFINRITTNETYFFREGKHFEYLENYIVPEWVEDFKNNKKPKRVWSCASSTGEEPYSIIITLINSMKAHGKLDFKFLGSDINSDVLVKAKEAVYKRESVEKYINHNLIARYFLDYDQNSYQVRPEVKAYATFKQINLQSERYPFKEKLDLIFCRNVMIYFDKVTKERLINRFYDHLNVGGYLIMGQSENLFSYDHKYKSMGSTVYKKV